jgi:hypothetical protein
VTDKLIVVFSGWRHWSDEAFIESVLDTYWLGGAMPHIRVGDCRTGADAIIRGWCQRAGLQFSQYLANWDLYGRSAGPIRNFEMITGRPYPAGLVTMKGATTDGASINPPGDLADILIAFPEPGARPGTGSGTWGCISEAWKAGVEVHLPSYPKRRLYVAQSS